MQCPNDNTVLVMTDRAGIEIDYCPQCRGVWLDRGELDKIIERSDNTAGVHAPAPLPSQEYLAPTYGKKVYDSHNRKHKKESFLGDLFDF